MVFFIVNQLARFNQLSASLHRQSCESGKHPSNFFSATWMKLHVGQPAAKSIRVPSHASGASLKLEDLKPALHFGRRHARCNMSKIDLVEARSVRRVPYLLIDGIVIELVRGAIPRVRISEDVSSEVKLTLGDLQSRRDGQGQACNINEDLISADAKVLERIGTAGTNVWSATMTVEHEQIVPVSAA